MYLANFQKIIILKKTKHFFLILFLLQSIFSYASIDTENNQARYEIGRLIVPIGTLSVPAVGVATKLGRIKNVLKGLKKLSKPKKTKFFDEVVAKVSIKRFIAKSSTELKQHLSKLKDLPKGITYKGEMYRYAVGCSKIYSSIKRIICKFSFDSPFDT